MIDNVLIDTRSWQNR